MGMNSKESVPHTLSYNQLSNVLQEMVTNQDTKQKFTNRLKDQVTSPVIWDDLPLTEDLSPQHLAEPTLGRREPDSPGKQ